MSPLTTFDDPVAALLTLPEPTFDDDPADWPAYGQLGLEAANVPELLRLATDPWRLGAPAEDLPEAAEGDLEAGDAQWSGPVHAWRALAVLGAESAIDALVHLVCQAAHYENDWTFEELPAVIEDFGAAAVPALLARLDEANHDQEAYYTWAETLGRIGAGDPAVRDTVVDALMAQLAHHATNDPTLNAFFVAALVTMNATVAAPVIEAAFAGGHVDEKVTGDWGHVQVALRLKPPDAAWMARQKRLEREARGEVVDEVGEGEAAGPPAVKTAAQKAKAKAKKSLQKASRKKNRKR